MLIQLCVCDTHKLILFLYREHMLVSIWVPKTHKAKLHKIETQSSEQRTWYGKSPCVDRNALLFEISLRPRRPSIAEWNINVIFTYRMQMPCGRGKGVFRESAISDRIGVTLVQLTMLHANPHTRNWEIAQIDYNICIYLAYVVCVCCCGESRSRSRDDWPIE